MRVTHETAVAARLDGGDNVGYLVGRRAMELALSKVRAHGIAMVAAHNTWYTGMLSYYAEMAVAEGQVAMIASNATAWVAPHGATEGRFGTNPICFGFPGKDAPVIWDIGTSIIIHADAMLARRLGKQLPEGVAYDAAGAPTTDPAAALSGALVAWGGAKGSGLGLVVQLLGIMAGSTVIPPEVARFGFLILAIDPASLTAADQWKTDVAAYADAVRGARPVPNGVPVRMPFYCSREERRRRLAEDAIDVADTVYEALRRVAGASRHAF